MTLATTQPNWDYLTSTPDLLVSNLSHLGLIEVTGEQGKTFIHGQVTTDIVSLTETQWRWGAHCDPKGKMIASFRTYTVADSLFVLMPASVLPLSLASWQKYAVFSKAELTDVTAKHVILGFAGSQAAQFIEQQFGPVEHEVTHAEGAIILKDAERFMVITSAEKAQQLVAASNQPLSHCQAWQALEIQAGYANIDDNHSSEFVPQMCNIQAVNGISFEKGCYMGQETIARMKYRGGNKRALYILSGSASETVSSETQIEIASEDGFLRAGKVIEAVELNGQVLLTAVLANDTPNDATLRVKDDSQSELVVKPLPYSLED
ncbi:tRNA-modifying protein YgfZ [Shewanella sp. UCD-KL21]|uniref:tRNA-modifying protein YgfZ n=1 Tax=Shewanella sp. UCD-KL21 TaxID=1917164 RepID=UPI000970239A|nr:tRNA-modifying protein YgfZ [Shewanella sp. UCD-KL21]